MSNITNPHDKFFKESFSRLEVVQSFIETAFPVTMKEKINLNSLQLTNASFTDSVLTENFADLVYRGEYAGRNAMITLLFEHKSYPQEFPHWQLLRYMTNVWRSEQKQDQKPTVVIPIIIYHGETAWKKMPFKSYFDNPPEELLLFLPEFDYLLFSLNDWQDYQIADFKNTFFSLATMLLKHSRDEKELFLSLESFWIEKLKALDEAQENDYIRSVFLYMENSQHLTTNDIIIIFAKVSTNVTNIAMTALERTKLEVSENVTFNFVKGLFEDNVDKALISKYVQLPLQKVEEIIQKIKGSSH